MTKFDLWRVFDGNPYEVDPLPLICKYCGDSYHVEDGDDDLCRTCARAGVFFCEFCTEWRPAAQKAFEDLCTVCAASPLTEPVPALYHATAQP